MQSDILTPSPGDVNELLRVLGFPQIVSEQDSERLDPENQILWTTRTFSRSESEMLFNWARDAKSLMSSLAEILGSRDNLATGSHKRFKFWGYVNKTGFILALTTFPKEIRLSVGVLPDTIIPSDYPVGKVTCI